MIPVIIESPFNAPKQEDLERNIRYARACLRYALHQGAAPFASHLLYTQPGVLCDFVPEERDWGIKAGQCLGDLMNETWVFTDLGISKGMEYGIERAMQWGRLIKHIELGPDWEAAWLGVTQVKTFA